MANNHSSSMANILAAIQEGCLTVEEIRRRLIAAIDLEYTKGDQANIKLIEACENLLWELEFSNKPRPASCKAQLHRFLELEFERRERKSRHRRMLLRTVAVSAACLLIFLSAGNILHWTWFEDASTPDGQQYMVQGHEITVQMVESAIAEHQDSVYDIEDIDQLQAHLSFDPGVPQNVLSQFTLQECRLFFFPSMIQINAYYGNSRENAYAISYILNLYSDVENAFISIEQNDKGDYIDINNQRIYLTENTEYSVANWQTGNSIHSVSISNVIQDTQEVIIDILGGK